MHCRPVGRGAHMSPSFGSQALIVTLYIMESASLLYEFLIFIYAEGAHPLIVSGLAEARPPGPLQNFWLRTCTDLCSCSLNNLQHL